MSQKAPTIKLGGAPYEDATQASIHYQTPALLKVMFRMHEDSVKDLTVAVLRTACRRRADDECDAKPAKIIRSELNCSGYEVSKLVNKQEETRRDFIRRTWASYTTGKISRKDYITVKRATSFYQYFSCSLVGSYHACYVFNC